MESTVTSSDGTTISYRTAGRGPGVILLPGSLLTAADFDGLARALAARGLTVHTLDRRGRGGSGPQGPAYSAERECEDIAAVRAATGATLVVGHSYGGFLALEAMAAGQLFERAALYEPGVLLDGPMDLPWADRCRRELAAGRPLEAFLTFIRGVNPELTGRVPRPILRLIILASIRRRERRQNYALLGGTILEHEEAARLSGQPGRYARIATPTLVMTGKHAGRTEAGRALGRLAAILPSCRGVTFPKLDHFGPRTNPDAVADAVDAFFRDGAVPGTDPAARRALP
jgi:pimeloyl-ACP methyl ester carboxylesterase